MIFEVFKGKDILPYVHDVACLRIEVFREEPYLYEGIMEEELSYARTYSLVKDSIFAVAKDEGKVIGIATGLPLVDGPKVLWEHLVQKHKPVKLFFYIAEIVVLKEYRGRKVGHELYKKLEMTVRNIGCFTKLIFYSVDQEKSKKPHKQRVLLERLGFVKQSGLETTFSWKKIGESESTERLMNAFLKDL